MASQYALTPTPTGVTAPSLVTTTSSRDCAIFPFSFVLAVWVQALYRLRGGLPADAARAILSSARSPATRGGPPRALRAHRHTAVDRQNLAGDIACLFAGEVAHS